MQSKPIYSPEAESAVISSLLMSEDAIPEAIAILSADDFYEPIHNILFESIKCLYELEKKVDLVTVLDFLRKEQTLEKVGGPASIASYIRGNINAENIIWYANIVKEKSLLRQIVKKAGEVTVKAERKAEDLESTALEVVDLSRAIPGEVLSIKSLENLLPGVMKKIEKRIETKSGIEGYKTGFHSLDNMFLGVRRREFFILAARPSFGKSCFVLNLATNFAKQGIPILFFSFEMDIENLNERLLAAESRLSYNKIISGDLDEFEVQRLTETIVSIESLPLFFVADYKRNISRIEKTIREFKIKHKEFVVIIDYLQLISSSKGQTREQEVADISRRLKNLTMESDILIVAISQLSRKVDSRGKNAKPILSDLRESGEIEQDADIVLFLHRDQEKIFEESSTETIELFLAKRRNGATGKTKLTFHKNYARFDNCGSGF
jgi:replicative DNA helicase